MPESTRPNSVVKFRLTASAAQQRVREISKDSSFLIWTDHIDQRMTERGIDTDAVLRILRTGDVEDDPAEGNKTGDWKIKIVRTMGTGRTAGVVTVLLENGCLVLITAEWEDRR